MYPNIVLDFSSTCADGVGHSELPGAFVPHDCAQAPFPLPAGDSGPGVCGTPGHGGGHGGLAGGHREDEAGQQVVFLVIQTYTPFPHLRNIALSHIVI